jgi:hypothetical protein
MTRRETLLKIAGIAGGPVFLAGCNMDAVRRAEAQLGDRMRRPGTGVQFSGLPEVVKVMVLATYPATPKQTQVAEQRARTAVAVIAKREGKKYAAKVPKQKAAEEKPATLVAEDKAAASSDVQVAAAALQAQTGTTVIAVDAPPDSRLKGDGTVMLWNTQTQRFVGNNVYDIASPPAKGQVAQWGSTTARYVGSGTF